LSLMVRSSLRRGSLSLPDLNHYFCPVEKPKARKMGRDRIELSKRMEIQRARRSAMQFSLKYIATLQAML
jgi:hypothetical protein